MLFFNLFAQLILFVAAWIATAPHEAAPAPQEKVGSPSPRRPSGWQRRTEPVMVPQPVAARSVQVGLGAGYVTGAATGVGLGRRWPGWWPRPYVAAADRAAVQRGLVTGALAGGWPMPASSSPNQSAG